jgi:hypothetical protein
MEAAYLNQNKREYEITKHVSVMQLDPMALIGLKELGQCEFTVPEALFDLDFPGHYMRRIKSVSVTIPCVVGPYTSVPCTVTLLKSTIRHSGSMAGEYDRDIQNDDDRFTDVFSSIQSVVTSSGQGDSGLFETNLRDERYLPFEGSGAISTWRLELPANFKAFDYDSISDVILHLRYTAREGGEGLKSAAASELQTAINSIVTVEHGNGVARLFSLKHEFPSEWHQFLSTADKTTGAHKQVLPFGAERFSFYLRAKFDAGTVKVTRLHVVAIPRKEVIDEFSLYLAPTNKTRESQYLASSNGTKDEMAEIALTTSAQHGGYFYGLIDYVNYSPQKLGEWSLLMTEAGFKKLKDKNGELLISDLLICFELAIG